MHYLRILFLSILCFAGQSFADSVDIGLSNNLIAANYTVDLSKSFEIRTDLFHSDVKNTRIKPHHASNFKEDTSTDFVSVGVLNHGDVGPVRLYIGGELFWLRSHIDHIDNYSAGGAALATQLDVWIVPKFLFSTGLHYAPDILTNGDYKSLLKFNFRFSYQVINSTSIYFAYRYLNGWGKDMDARLYNGPLIGVKFSF